MRWGRGGVAVCERRRNNSRGHGGTGEGGGGGELLYVRGRGTTTVGMEGQG